MEKKLKTMWKGGPIVLLLAAAIDLVVGYCPVVTEVGKCSYRIQCVNNIGGIRLANECRGAINYPVFVDLSLTDVTEDFGEQDSDLLNSVTTLHILGNSPQLNDAILESMPQIHSLYLTGNSLKEIKDSPFYNMNHLEQLDLSRNFLEDVENVFNFESDPNKLKKLSLSQNALKFLSASVFSELTSLIELDLSQNFISDLSQEPFSNLTNLITLKLDYNKIEDLNGAVNNLTNLKHLYLKGNHIQNIDAESLNIINHLLTFDISSNNLNSLKPILFTRHWEHVIQNKHFAGTCKIIIAGNRITSLPNTTNDFTLRPRRGSQGKNIEVLTEVDLARNAISNIEYDAFQSIIRLTSLDLSCNQLKGFVVNPTDLIHVRYLNLSSNYITNLYFESFLSMTNLQNLDLSHNYLNYIPDETFTNSYNLKYVNMTSNDIKKLENLRIKIFNGEGGVLDLSNNSISRLQVPSGDEICLTMLILNFNDIKDVSNINLNEQSKLRNLEMSGNQIEELDDKALHLPLRLVDLDLSHNKIRKIGPATFHRNMHLRTLKLSHNKLQNLEYGSFQGLTDLSYLSLSYNNIGYLDAKLLIDLKSLRILSLSHNGMLSLEYNVWLGHKTDLKVYVEGNRLSCEWLAKALTDFNNGYSKMRPTVFEKVTSANTIEGIPCAMEKEKLIQRNIYEADDRLLITNQKILEAIKEQSSYLKSILFYGKIKNHFIHNA